MFAKGIEYIIWGSKVLFTALMLSYPFFYFLLAFHELHRIDVDLKGRAKFGLRTFLILEYRMSSFSTVSFNHILLYRIQILFLPICTVSFRTIVHYVLTSKNDSKVYLIPCV